MQRNNSGEALIFRKSTPEALARYTTNTIINELPFIQMFSSYTNALSIDPIVPGMCQLTGMLEKTSAEAFNTGDCYELIMGKNTTPEQVWNFLNKEIV